MVPAKTPSQNTAFQLVTSKAPTTQQLALDLSLNEPHPSQLSVMDRPTTSVKNNASFNFGGLKNSFTSNTSNENMLDIQPDQRQQTNESEIVEVKETSKNNVPARPVSRRLYTSGHVKKYISSKGNGTTKITQHLSDKLTIQKMDTQPNEKKEDEEIVRDPPELLAQLNFLKSKEEPKAVDVNQITSFKFLFARNKGEKAYEILKQKQLNLGVFASNTKINYLQHQQPSPAPTLLRRLSHEQPPEFISKAKLYFETSLNVHNSGVSPRQQLTLTNLAKTDFTSQRATTAKTHVRKASFQTTPQNLCGQVSPNPDYGYSATADTASKGNARCLTQVTTPRPQEPIILLTSRILTPRPIHQRTEPPTVSKTCKNGIYANLIQKSINHKKLFHRRNSSESAFTTTLQDFRKGKNMPQMKLQINRLVTTKSP